VTRIPVTLVFGRLGAGKTRWINEQLKARPDGQRIAVLQNELGRTPLNVDSEVWLETSLGCACCTGSLAFNVTLVRMLRRIESDRRSVPTSGNWRLMIEADSRVEPTRMVDRVVQPNLIQFISLEQSVQLPRSTGT
jgi:G3E family GTPase